MNLQMNDAYVIVVFRIGFERLLFSQRVSNLSVVPISKNKRVFKGLTGFPIFLFLLTDAEQREVRVLYRRVRVLGLHLGEEVVFVEGLLAEALGGIEGALLEERLPRGQIEASTALNLSPFRTAVGVVLPRRSIG